MQTSLPCLLHERLSVGLPDQINKFILHFVLHLNDNDSYLIRSGLCQNKIDRAIINKRLLLENNEHVLNHYDHKNSNKLEI